MTTSRKIASIALILCACTAVLPLSAQDKAKNTFGKVTPADFNLPASPIVDSNTTAVVLSDIGEAHYVGNFSMDIPDGYTVDELPKSVRVGLNGDQGHFDYLIAQQDGKIQLRCRFKLNKATFSPEEYGNLRDFCAFVIKKEVEQIVLKKK